MVYIIDSLIKENDLTIKELGGYFEVFMKGHCIGCYSYVTNHQSYEVSFGTAYFEVPLELLFVYGFTDETMAIKFILQIQKIYGNAQLKMP